jgi:hypothetical protein
MPLYEVVTMNGQRLVIEAAEKLPSLVIDNARASGRLLATEKVERPGRQPEQHDIAIPFHAIVVVRAK